MALRRIGLQIKILINGRNINFILAGAFLKRNSNQRNEKTNKPDIVTYGRNDNKNFFFFANSGNVNQRSRALQRGYNFLIGSACSIHILQL